MKQYYQGEDIPFSIPFSGEFQNAADFSEFSEIRAYVYTDGCLIQKFSTVNKSGYDKAALVGGELTGIIKSEYSSLFSPGALVVEIVGIKPNSELRYDIGKKTIGSIRKSLIKAEMTVETEPPTIPDPKISINPSSVTLSEDGEGVIIGVTIDNNPNTPYIVNGVPSWLHVSQQNQSGFFLTADSNQSEDLRSVDLSVQLVGFSSHATLKVNQTGNWLSEFRFDVYTSSSNETPARVINLGAILEGQGKFDWGDGSAVEILEVPKSTEIQFSDNETGLTQSIYIGKDFTHKFVNSGNHTVTVRTRQGVNAVRFSTFEGADSPDYGAEYVSNPYIRKIRKIKSDSLTSANKLFAGCTRASFAPEFIQSGLETPNVVDVSFAFENFGSAGVSGTGYTVADNMRFPNGLYKNFAKKNQITSATRVYYGSGFERISQDMLSFSADNTLLSVFECFRSMKNVGKFWIQKYGAWDTFQNMYDSVDIAGQPGTGEFVETSIFQKQHNISDFTGVFNAINDDYDVGLKPCSQEGWSGQYMYTIGARWLIRKELFQGNTATNLKLDFAFNKATNALFEEGFMLPIAQKIVSMDGCFWNYQGTNIGGSQSRIGTQIVQTIFRGVDLNNMFPDSSYPNMISMVGAFGFGTGTNSSNSNKRDTRIGFNTLIDTDWIDSYNNESIPLNVGAFMITPTSIGTEFNPTLNHNMSIASFLNKFPNVKTDSGILNKGGDGAAWNFWDFDAVDSADVKKASDYDTYNIRPIVKQFFILN